ncbi:protein diaphanous homolog 2-like isoform X2 [Watersipora subatra]|uniref:protein diaphanous homolog 2-like isoform X2 n=1 Tax=Watersipora subatra TaxID=2589382 RepID=UPI00355C9579
MDNSRRESKLTGFPSLAANVKRNHSFLKFGGKKGKRESKVKSNYEVPGADDADLQKQIKEMSDREVEERFEEMLTDMNLMDEAKRAPLRKKPMGEKRTMLAMQYRGAAIQKSSANIENPASFVHELTNRDLTSKQRFELMTQLRVSLTSNTVTWVMEFGKDGLESILDNLNTCLQATSERKSATECVRCLKAFTNSKYGLKLVLGHETALTILARAIDIRDEVTMLETVKLMAAVCLVPPLGHSKVLEGITDLNELRQNDERFAAIVKGMTHNNINMRVACLQLTNAIISTPDDLDFRIHLRNEFWRAGIIDIVESLEKDENEAVKVQSNILLSHKDDDADDFSQRTENIRAEFDDSEDCFHLISNSIAHTTTESYFLSILQHLMYIREDPFVRLQYYKLIEECITQIVLHKSGADPDFRYTKRFNIDVDPLIGNIMEKTKEEGIRGGVERGKLEEALTAKQESEAKVSALELKNRELSMDLADLKKKMNDSIAASISDSLSRPGGIPPPPGVIPPPPGGIPPPPGGIPPPPPPPGGIPPPPPGGIPPPPPPPGGIPPPPPGMGPPAPPPPPGMGPPPPPPPPGMGPPPPPGMGPPGPPPPPGMGPPGPPPPGMMGFAARKPANALPSYIKPKKKYVLEQPTKRANWNPIKPQDVGEDAFWAQANEERLGDDDMFATLNSRFSSKPPPSAAKNKTEKVEEGDASSVKNSEGTKKPSKKNKQLRILDGKSGQGLSILLGSVKAPYKELRRRILAVDEQLLTQTLIEQLVKILPEASVMKSIGELEGEFENLAEPEQFCVVMSSVKRLHPRLNSILFKMRFNDLVDDIKPDIVAATAACEEVKQSGKFKKLLELVLLIGNYMNAGSKKEQSIGFEMNFLTKLENTKSQDQKQTLLHFLAQIVEEKFPDVLDYENELIHVDQAARVSDEILAKNISQMSKSLKQLEIDIKNVENQKADTADPDDKFAQVMSAFIDEAREQFSVLQQMYEKMQDLYRHISKFYVFDMKKYTLDEFFGDIKAFKEKFYMAVKQNRTLRETEEKIKRIKEAKEKAESDKKAKMARKKQLIDLSKDDDDQEGVMDNLLDALQKGTAFNLREGGRKRTPRTTGAERRAQLQKSRSKGQLVENSRELDSNAISTETPRRPDRRKNTRPADSMMPEEFEGKADDLMNRLNAL